MVGLPKFGLARDGCFRCIGCDNTFEDGSILLAGRGVKDQLELSENGKSTDIAHEEFQKLDDYLSDDPILDKLDIPPGTLKSNQKTFADVHCSPVRN